MIPRKGEAAMKNIVCVGLVMCLAQISSGAAFAADEQPYSEGTVMHMTFIRVKPGGDEEYMKFLSTQWKSLCEAEKKEGLILSYHVIEAPAANRDDWDIALVVEFKNMAALDGLDAKVRPLVAKMAGSVAKADEQAGKRGEIREILGEKIGRELILK
jgi:hypothetical protein